mgnify:CR=1 FL=1
MRVTFITPAPALRRLGVYRAGARLYGTRDSITGPLILAGILRRAGHEVEAYEELNGDYDVERLLERTDVLCLYTMTSTAPRAYALADLFHESGATPASSSAASTHRRCRRRRSATPTRSSSARGRTRSSTSWRAGAPSRWSAASPPATSTCCRGPTTRCSGPPSRRPTS